MNSLVLRTSLHHSVTIDVARQRLTVVSSNLLFVPKVKMVAFEEIQQVYLDYLEQTYTVADTYGAQKRIERKWTIFLFLTNGQILTVAEETTSLKRQSRYWEYLATRICELTGKTLVRTPSVPGGAHTFVENVDQILQGRLAQAQLHNRYVHLRSGEDGSLEIVVDGKIYGGLDEVEDRAVRDLIQASVDEWQGNDVPVPSASDGPRTFVESIDQILQRRLTRSQLHSRSVRLRSSEDGRLEIMVDGRIYGGVEEVEEEVVRDLIRASVDEWQGNDVRVPSVSDGRGTLVESIDQILQRRLTRSQLHNRYVHLRSGEDGSLEIVVDGRIYGGVDEVEDRAVRDLIQVSVDEWQEIGRQS